MNDGRCLCGVCVLDTIARVADGVQSATSRRKVLLHRQRPDPSDGGVRGQREAGRRLRKAPARRPRQHVPGGRPRQLDDPLARPFRPRQFQSGDEDQLDAPRGSGSCRAHHRGRRAPPPAGLVAGPAGSHGRSCGHEHQRPRYHRPRPVSESNSDYLSGSARPTRVRTARSTRSPSRRCGRA